VLTLNEQERLWKYLDSAAPSHVTGEYLDLNSTGAQRLILMTDLLLCTGMRASELVKLRIEHTPFVLGTNVIEIHDSKYRRDRTVDVSDRLTKSVERYILHVRPRTLPRHVIRSDIKKPLFYNNREKPYTRRSANGRTRASCTMNREVRALGAHAGIAKELRPHMLRHTFAVNSLHHGVDVRTLQVKMGHSSLSITERYLQLVNAEGLGEKLDARPGQIGRIFPCKTA